MELRVEERDRLDERFDLLVCLKIGSHAHRKGSCSAVAGAWIDSADAVVLVLPHKGHVLLFLVHALPVKEDVRVENTLHPDCRKIWRSLLTIQAKVIAITHAIDEALSDKIADIFVRFAPKSDTKNFGT